MWNLGRRPLDHGFRAAGLPEESPGFPPFFRGLGQPCHGRYRAPELKGRTTFLHCPTLPHPVDRQEWGASCVASHRCVLEPSESRKKPN
ncbi:hypothetical protein [Azospirillum doebereinerae]